MRGPLTWLGLVLGLMAAGVPGHAQSSDAQSSDAPFTLAVVRRDGVLVPFATFTGEDFRRSWPEAEGRTDVPATLDAIPSEWWGDRQPHTTWRFQPLDGRARSLEVESPIWVPVQCQQQTALLTNYRTATPPPPPDVQPYPKDGLAWTGDATVAPIEILTRDSSVWQRLGRQLAPTMNEREREAIAREEEVSRWRHPAGKEVRGRTSLKLEAVYEAPATAQGDRFYYVEATKRYKRTAGDRDADCDVLSFMSGWASVDSNDRVAATHIGAAVTACDYNSVPIMYPLALLRVNGRSLWIVQWSAWGEETYEILAPSSKRVDLLFETTAGECSE